MIFALIASLWLAGAGGQNAYANPIETANVKAWLVSATEEPAAGEAFWVALRIEARPGWHTYWKNPGDSGEPTAITWNLPDGFSASDIHWPSPHRIPVGPLVNFGYEGDLYLPVKITPPADLAPGKRVTLKAQATWLVCEDICIPEEGDFELGLKAANGPPVASDFWQPRIEKALAAAPIASPWNATFSSTDERVRLLIQTESLVGNQIRSVAFFPESDGYIINSAEPEISIGDHGVFLEFAPGHNVASLGATFGGVLSITESLGAETVTRAFDVQAARGAVDAPYVSSFLSEIGWAQAVLFAFLGGIILNLMPCVLPILSMKALSVVETADHAPGLARKHGLVYGLGVILSFLIVAGVLLLLRGAGEQIGWGYQLQSPSFVLFLALLMFAIGLNLAGLFSVGGGVSSIGSGLARQEGLAGSFFTGVLATVVATPCTAPFMAAAIGYALTLSPVLSLTIFAALGAGMASPYVALSFSPRVLGLLPKPGAWMETFKQVLAFPMFGTAAWLLWVLSAQAGSRGLMIALIAAMLFAFALWLYEKTKASTGGARLIGGVVVAAAIGAALFGTFWVDQPTDRASLERDPSAYSEERLNSFLADGTPVFVNFTADWCITCKVNERLALGLSSVDAAFVQHGVERLVGDWTLRDAMITAKLEEFERAGVPLYLLYRSVGEPPTILPQVLTEGIILEALNSL